MFRLFKRKQKESKFQLGDVIKTKSGVYGRVSSIEYTNNEYFYSIVQLENLKDKHQIEIQELYPAFMVNIGESWCSKYNVKERTIDRIKQITLLLVDSELTTQEKIELVNELKQLNKKLEVIKLMQNGGYN